jgi:hypothetical protein
MNLPDVDVYPWDDDRTEEMDSDAAADSCAYCDGPLVQLGTLGNRAHFRCRHCGAECSRMTVTPLAPSTDDGTLQPF